jgi:putative endonuclease
MKTMYVYLLNCSDGTYYTGVTNNLERRLEEHQSGLNKDSYTYRRRPLKLVYHETFDSPLQAITFEKRLKKWSSKKKEALINGRQDLLPELSKSKSKQ